MLATIIGMGDIIQGTSKKTGKLYFGQSLNLSFTKPGITGVAVMEQFVSFLELDQPPKFKVNDTIYLDFDSNGRLLGFELDTPPAK